MLYFLRTIALNLPRLTRAVGIVLILAVGLIHLYLAPMHFEAATYIGVAFVINFVASLISDSNLDGHVLLRLLGR